MIDNAHVDKMAQRIQEEVGPRIIALTREAANFANDFDTLLNFADKLGGLIIPYTPCASGCSHCCYMAVVISDSEAQAISRFTGRELKTKGELEKYVFSGKDQATKYAAVPCTFLEDGACSIYSVRPAVCRLHHNLAQSPDNCKITVGLKDMEATPSVDFADFHRVFVGAVINRGEGFADIREFFPSKG